MFFECDPSSLSWIEAALHHPVRRVRIDALNLLSVVDCARRHEWLADAQRDADPTVAATAALVEATVRCAEHGRFDLFESDFAQGQQASDLQWEWEYALAVCHDYVFPGALTHVWVSREDDDAARAMAVMKNYVGRMEEVGHAVALVVDKRLVTQHTRRPKSSAEARRWYARGRPRYRES